MKFTKTLAAITAAAMAVSMAAIPASAVESELGTSGTCIAKKGEWGPDATCIQINGKAVDENSAFDFAATDVVTVTAAAANGEDTSLWNLAFNCFDASWGGWQGVQSEAGVLELTATVQDMMDAISVTDAANFGGFIFQVWNCQVGDEIDWTIKIAPGEVTPEEPEEPEEPEDAPETEVPGESEEVPGESEDVPTDPEVPGETTDPEEPGEDPEEPGEEPEEPAKPAAPTKVEITNGGRTVIDSGLVRTNIFNEWTGNDADMIVDKTAFAGANLISVKFTVTGVTEAFDAWIDFADSTWAIQYWGEDADGNAGVTQTPVRIEKDGTYVLTAKLDAVIDAIAYMSIKTNLAAEGEVAPITITIDEIMINEEIKLPVDQPEDPEEPGETTEPEEPGEEPEEPGETTEPEEPGESTTPGESSGTPMNPGTGVALVVVPAALAAAALATSGIVLKKRSK